MATVLELREQAREWWGRRQLGGCGGLCWSGLSGSTGKQEALCAEWSVCRAEPEGIPLAEGPCPANDMVLCLLHSCLGQELSDREIPLTTPEQATFLREVLRRTCHGPGELPISLLIADLAQSLCPTPQGGFCLWVLAFPSLHLRALPLLVLPSHPSLLHCRTRGVTRGGTRDPKGSSNQQRPGHWRPRQSCPG